MSDKKAQRQRRKSGYEQISPFVYMPKFIAWLIWEGYLDPGATKLPPIERRAAITKAVERHLYRCYSPLADPSPAPKPIIVDWPGYASGSLAQDIQDTAPFPLVGVLEREGELAKHYGLSPTYVISGYKAARRPDIGKSKPIYTYPYAAVSTQTSRMSRSITTRQIGKMLRLYPMTMTPR
jgi:hypothetical protein